jgi:hypothetical protein
MLVAPRRVEPTPHYPLSRAGFDGGSVKHRMAHCTPNGPHLALRWSSRSLCRTYSPFRVTLAFAAWWQRLFATIARKKFTNNTGFPDQSIKQFVR